MNITIICWVNRPLLINLFLDRDHFSSECSKKLLQYNLLILDVKQLNKIMKPHYFYTLKALWDNQGKIKMYYGMSSVKKQLQEKGLLIISSLRFLLRKIMKWSSAMFVFHEFVKFFMSWMISKFTYFLLIFYIYFLYLIL